MSNYQVPEGYKQTEVGVIPEDWEVRALSECCAKITDGTHDTPQPVRSGIPYLTAIHVKSNHIDFENCYFLPEAVHAEIFKRCNPEQGDVLMVNIGAGVATTALVDVSYEFSLKNVALIKPNSQKLLGKYLNQIQIYRREQITQSLLSGGAQPFLSLSEIGKIKVAFPPNIGEQSSIAQTLSDVDALIAALDKLIAKKRHLKTATMQQLLTGKKRLPGFGEGKGYKQTEVGVIPEDWEVATLEGICPIGGLVRGPFGGALKKEFFVKAGYKVYEQRNAIYRSIEIGNYYIDANKFNELSRFKVDSGDLIVSCSGTIGCIYEIPEDAPQGVINQALLKIELNKDMVDKDFFLAIFRSEVFQERITDNSHGGAMQNLVGMETFKNTILQLPPLKEQRAIATVLSDMDTAISALETRCAKTQAIKQGMMQELLTGRTRLTINS